LTFSGTLFEEHTHPDRAHRHETSEVAIPKGTIWLWYGTAAAVPVGWAICDGTNGTPDMRGRVPVGVDTGQTEFDVLGEAGGAKTHTLITAEMPVHNHPWDDSGFGLAVANEANPAGGIGHYLRGTGVQGAGNAGSGSAHANLQPYRALHFIMKK
jgi:microcystin-dependent protein